MADTTTSFLALTKPQVGGSNNTWGAKINTDLDILDTVIYALETACKYGVLTSNYTLTNTTSLQKLFNWSTNGALTLLTGYYKFKYYFRITSLSATSGNCSFDLLGAGTATLANMFHRGWGRDANNTLTSGNISGSGSNSAAIAADVISAGTGTEVMIEGEGVFNVTAGGTIIPSVALTTAAAGVVQAGSYFTCQSIGSSNTQGAWS